jgi:hypothetical protein
VSAQRSALPESGASNFLAARTAESGLASVEPTMVIFAAGLAAVRLYRKVVAALARPKLPRLASSRQCCLAQRRRS